MNQRHWFNCPIAAAISVSLFEPACASEYRGENAGIATPANPPLCSIQPLILVVPPRVLAQEIVQPKYTVQASGAKDLRDRTKFELGLTQSSNDFFGEASREDLKLKVGCVWQPICTANWTLSNAFRAAYVSWDVVETFDRNWQPHNRKLDRSFDEDYSLDEFYILQADLSREFKTGSLKHETAFGLELSKSPVALSGEGTDRQASDRFNPYQLPIPSPFSATDFFSNKNSLNLYLEHEIAVGERLELSFEGELELLIPDIADTPNLPTIDRQENQIFTPEVEISYQLTESVSVYASFSRSSLPVSGTDFQGKSFKSEIDNESEVGIETEFLNGMTATLYLNNSTQKNVATIDPDNPDFEVQVDEQQSQWIGLNVEGEIMLGWYVMAYYAYTNARITKDDQFPIGNQINDVPQYSGGFWTTYAIQDGWLQGLGLGGGVRFVGDRSGDLENSFELPSYWQTDVVIFFQRENWKAVLSIENLFNQVYFDGKPLTVVGTAWIEF